MWETLYPILIHFGISQIVAYLAIYALVRTNKGDASAYHRYVAALTGITGLLSAAVLLYFKKRDEKRRIAGGLIKKRSGAFQKSADSLLKPAEIPAFLIIGAILGIVGNMVIAYLASWIPFGTVYEDTMNAITEGQKLWQLILWIGVAAPFAEEVVFRWLVYLRLRDHCHALTAAVLSGVLFGIYHMNLLQGIYASCLGILFALLLEWRGNLWVPVLLHIGANSWGLIVSALYSLGDMRTAEILFFVQAAALIFAVKKILNYRKEYVNAGQKRVV